MFRKIFALKFPLSGGKKFQHKVSFILILYKYNPCEKVDCYYPETGAFTLEKNNDENAKEKYEFEDCELKGKLKIKLAIKSLLMKSDD